MLEKFLRCWANYKSGEGRLNSNVSKNVKVEFGLAKGFFCLGVVRTVGLYGCKVLNINTGTLLYALRYYLQSLKGSLKII